ncbi:TadE/TadG family type IV pilus assembly protein [Nocardiopsis baichengensis]|uniref:TadE/TadG family type IV pilus assembly protein n=1 Tax=Nocardiopsis baichengensis TaxID=280240 RepID=UPI000685A875|nr:TadE/TadG family type IV pilus assembly protein [Nocardiopsis baichengensis]
MRPKAGRERGSAAVELMAVAPVLILAALLMVAAGRQVSAAMDTASAAHSAARAAALATEGHRQGAAEAQAEASLAERGLACRHHRVSVRTLGPERAPSAVATLTCRIALRDLAPLGLGGHTTLARTSSAPIDPYRDAQPGSADSETPEGADEQR